MDRSLDVNEAAMEAGSGAQPIRRISAGISLRQTPSLRIVGRGLMRCLWHRLQCSSCPNKKLNLFATELHDVPKEREIFDVQSASLRYTEIQEIDWNYAKLNLRQSHGI